MYKNEKMKEIMQSASRITLDDLDRVEYLFIDEEGKKHGMDDVCYVNLEGNRINIVAGKDNLFEDEDGKEHSKDDIYYVNTEGTRRNIVKMLKLEVRNGGTVS